LYVQQLFYSPWGYGISVRGTGDGMSFALGPVHLLLTGVAALLLRPIWRASARAGALLAAFLAFTIVAVFFSTNASLFLWEHVDVLATLQFPWRFLSFTAASTSFACGAPFLLLRGERQRAAGWLMAALIAAIFLVNFRHANPSGFDQVTDADYSPATIHEKALAASRREFEPIDVRQFPPIPAREPMMVTAGKADVAVTGRTPTERTFGIRVEQDALLRLNTFFFPGWTLYVDGARRPIAHSNQQGLMDFPLKQGTHAVRFVFLDTPIRTWSTRLSLGALLLLVLAPTAPYAIARCPRRRRNAADATSASAALKVAH
jgi:hypothetical protein